MTLIETLDRLDKAISEHAEVAEDAKTAKKRVESLQEDLRTATKALRSCRDDQEPNPKRYPLLDKPKAPAPAKAEADVAIKEELNQLFPAPEAIKPLPAADFEEHYRRSARDKKLADFAEVIDEATLKILAEKGINTVADVGRFSAENPKGIMSIRTSEGRMTEKRQESLLDAIAAWTMGVQDDWAAEHPEKGGDS
jgi:ATP-dependent exoDNAse (exonuclease V) beta subunit